MASLYQPGGLIFATETGTIISPFRRGEEVERVRTSSPPCSAVPLEHPIVLVCNIAPVIISAVGLYKSLNQGEVVGKVKGIVVARHRAERWWEG